MEITPSKCYGPRHQALPSGACTRARKRIAFTESTILFSDSIVMILSHLDHVADIARASQVCRAWRRLCMDEIIWSKAFTDNEALRGEVETIVRSHSSAKAFTLAMAVGRPQRSLSSISSNEFKVLVSLGNGERLACAPQDGGAFGAMISCPLAPATLTVGHDALCSLLTLRVDLLRCSDGACVNLAVDWRPTSQIFDDNNGGAMSCSFGALQLDAFTTMWATTTAYRADCNFPVVVNDGTNEMVPCKCTPCMLRLESSTPLEWTFSFEPLTIDFEASNAHMHSLPLCGTGSLLAVFEHLCSQQERRPAMGSLARKHPPKSPLPAIRSAALALVLWHAAGTSIDDFLSVVPKVAALNREGLRLSRYKRAWQQLVSVNWPSLDVSLGTGSCRQAVTRAILSKVARGNDLHSTLVKEDVLLIVKVGGRAVVVSDLFFAADETGEYALIDLSRATPGPDYPFLYEAKARTHAAPMSSAASTSSRMELRVDALMRTQGDVVRIFEGSPPASVVAAAGADGEHVWRFEWDSWSSGERSHFHPLCRVTALLFVADSSDAQGCGDYSKLIARFVSGCSTLHARELQLTFHSGVPSHPLPPLEWAPISVRSSVQIMDTLAQSFLGANKMHG